MKLTQTEKANRYDALVCAVGVTKESYERQLKEIETELTQPTSDQIHAMLVGKKYLLMDVLENLGRWC